MVVIKLQKQSSWRQFQTFHVVWLIPRNGLFCFYNVSQRIVIVVLFLNKKKKTVLCAIFQKQCQQYLHKITVIFSGVLGFHVFSHCIQFNFFKINVVKLFQKSLDNLVKGGRICSREINSQASKKTISIYWLTSRQKPGKEHSLVWCGII